MDYMKLKSFVLKHNVSGKYKFVDRGNNNKRLCLILIGYKKELWPDVISRFKLFVPDDIDVCLMSSGKHFDELAEMAKQNGWSYLSTKKNNVCLIQNIAIDLFKSAELIYKMDEDIFLTEGAFEKLEKAMEKADRESPYVTGMAAPLLNVNAYGYYRILEKLGKLSDFEQRFGKPKMASGRTKPIESDGDVARFMWGDNGILPQLDEINRLFSKDDGFSICPIRLSIGFILFKRSFWESFWRFPVLPGNGMGLDETVMVGCSNAFSQVIAVAEDSVVGHFGYKDQGNRMKELYKEKRELFTLS